MGQHYDANGVYVKWSPYFDFTSLKTLEASKKLPTPKNVTVELSENGTNVTAEIDRLLSLSQPTNVKSDGSYTLLSILTPKELSEVSRVAYLDALGTLLKKIERAYGNISYKGEHNAALQVVLNTIRYHENYKSSTSVAEEAFKNAASANIYAVSHDIRNRDQAYTAISMANVQSVARNTPKGKAANSLNMLNPFTKYIMQYQNMVGKNVVGIMANGEKVEFNNYLYWTQTLMEHNPADLAGDDLKYLKFKTTLSRINGRKNGLANISDHTVTHIPDLNVRDEKIKAILESYFEADPNSLEYRYVDQSQSELISSATDFRYNK